MICLTGFEKTGSNWDFAVFKKARAFVLRSSGSFYWKRKKEAYMFVCFRVVDGK